MKKKVVVRKFVHRHRCTDTGAGARTGTGAYDQMEVSYLKQTFLHRWEIFAPVGKFLHRCRFLGTGAEFFAPVQKFLHRCKNVCTGAHIAPVFAPIPPVLFLFFSQGYLSVATFLTVAQCLC